MTSLDAAGVLVTRVDAVGKVAASELDSTNGMEVLMGLEVDSAMGEEAARDVVRRESMSELSIVLLVESGCATSTVLVGDGSMVVELDDRATA